MSGCSSSTAGALTAENYKHGFLVDDEVIGGVTEMADGVYAAYVSHYLTGETFEYQEFNAQQPALTFLNGLGRKWIYETVGCSTHTKKVERNASCSGCSCSK